MRRFLLVLLALSLAVTACGGSSKSAERTATPAPTQAAASNGDAGCQKVPAPKPKGPQHLPKPKNQLPANRTWVAVVDTSCGRFEITLDVKHAPKTASSFAYLARKGFYDDLTFHRILSGFVIQGGDPLGNGTGGPGYSIREAPRPSTTYRRGMVAMAKTAAEPPGTSGSQFFVVTGETLDLPPDYALVGNVTSGADVVDTIGTVPADPSTGVPVDPVVINSVKIVAR